jgi:DNA-binding XRE family transcriptional regulator
MTEVDRWQFPFGKGGLTPVVPPYDDYYVDVIMLGTCPAGDGDGEAGGRRSHPLTRSPTMNPIERLRDNLATRFPDLVAEIDAPVEEAGVWHLDVRPGGGSPWIVVEWKPDRGFGISTPGADDYGTKPDELYPNAKAAYDRVVQLILSRGRTEPPASVKLAELRQIRGLSQAEVAGRAGIKQAAIARIEGRDDILLSTLNRVVAAMGGTLSIRAEFPDGTERELTGSCSPPSAVRGEETPFGVEVVEGG